MRPILHIVCPVTREEAEQFAITLDRNIGLLDIAGVDYRIIIIFQSRKQGIAAIERFDSHPRIAIIRTSHYSVSRARNLALERIPRQEDSYIYFMDASVVPSKRFWELYIENSSKGIPHWMCNADWTGQAHLETQNCDFQVRGLAYLFGRMYVWVCVFRADIVGLLRFDESIGPGENHVNASGEDFLFVQTILVKNDLRRIRFYPTVMVSHPPRPSDFSKHLAYARGQGHMYRRLLLCPVAPILFKLVYASYLSLFLGNGLLRILLFKKRAKEIMASRLRGLLSERP